MNTVNVRYLTDLTFYMLVRCRAMEAMELTYRHWETWKDSKNPGTRSLALKAKAHGVVAHDRILCRTCY